MTVTEQAPLLDTSDSRFEQTLGHDGAADPAARRDEIQPMLSSWRQASRDAADRASPGTNNSTNFAPENWVDASANGRGANGNQYVVDGMDVTSSIRPGRHQSDAQCGCDLRSQRANQHLLSGLRARQLNPDA